MTFLLRSLSLSKSSNRLSPSLSRLSSISGSLKFSTSSPAHGQLIDLMVASSAEKENLRRSVNLVVDINERQSCDVQLLVNGGFSPLDGFMNKKTYDHVLEKMRLPETHRFPNLLFGLPVVLDTFLPESSFKPGQKVLLRFGKVDMAVLTVDDVFRPDKTKEVKLAYGTSELEHPGVRMVAFERGPLYVSGKLQGLEYPKRIYPSKTPKELRAILPSKDGKDAVAFQCRNPIHRAHYELFTRALTAPNVKQDGSSVVLVHPTCGPTQEDDISGEVRFQTYEVLKKEQNDPRVVYDYLPYSMHMAGPREAIQHMIIRKNYGCTHFIVGRDMAGSKSSITGEDYYGAYDAQDMAKKHSEELKIQVVPSLNLVYTKEAGYITAEDAEKKGLKPLKLSGTEFRRRLRAGEDIPEWFAFKSVVEVLRKNI